MAIRSTSRDTLKFMVSKISTQPPMRPATWNTSPKYMNSQSQSSHDTRRRGPGIEFSASSVVMRSTIAKRASPICTNTLTMQARMTNHSIEKPSAAPTFGVTMSSPEPTMAALMMRPGPRCEAVPSHPRGGSSTSPGCRALLDEGACVLELDATGVWLTGYLQQLFVELDRAGAHSGCLRGPRSSVEPPEAVRLFSDRGFELGQRFRGAPGVQQHVTEQLPRRSQRTG